MVDNVIPLRARPFVLGLSLCVLATGCQTLQLKGPLRAQDGDWWTTGGAANRNATTDQMLEPPLVEAWTYNALAGFGTGSALVFGDVVLVANLQGEVHAIDLESGKRKGQIAFKDAIAGTPAVSESKLIVGKAWGRRSMQSYDLEKATSLWKLDGPHIEASLLPVEGGIVAADMKGGVRLVNATSGLVVWSWQDPDKVPVLAAPLLSEGLVVSASRDGRVRAFDAATGAVRWTTSTDLPIYMDPVSVGGTLYVPTTRGVLLALNAATGREKWRFSAATDAVKLASPTVRGDVVYFGASDGFVRAISTSYGAVVWRAQLEAAVTAPLVVTGEHVYAGTMQNRLLALDAQSGTETWSTELKGRIKSAMAVAGGGLVVLYEPRMVSLFLPEAVHASR